MNKNEFLQNLKSELSLFSQEEKESAIAYYEEFFEEAGIENEQAVIASLGDPKTLAQSILKESGINFEQEASNNSNVTFTPPQTAKNVRNTNDGSRNALIIILLILSFPIWIGFVAGFFGIIFGLFAAVFGVLIAFIASSMFIFLPPKCFVIII